MQTQFPNFSGRYTRIRPRFNFSSLTLFVACLVLLATGCYKTSERAYFDLKSFTKSSSGEFYRTHCEAVVEKQDDRVSSGKYLEQSFDVRQWKGVIKPTSRIISESKLVEDLNTGNLNTLLIEARGGLGKSWLTTSLEAQICGKSPIFTVNLGKGLPSAEASGTKPGQILFDRIAESAHIPRTPLERQNFQNLLQKRPWILLVDAVDQVDIQNRTSVKNEIKAIAERYASTVRLIVLSRPPVLSTDSFGIPKLDTRIAVQTIGCARAEERVGKAVGEENTEKFWAFAEELDISRKTESGARCTYPHMATYRDVNVVTSMAKNQSFDATAIKGEAGWSATRSAIYGAFFRSVFATVQENTGISPSDGEDLIHNMFIAQKPAPGTRTINFSMNDCLGALAKGHTEESRKTCSTVLATEIFEAGDGAANWKFQNQSYADFFLAYWGNTLLITTEHETDCSRLQKISEFFESNEVGSFLVGMSHGEKCISQVINSLCDNGCLVEDTFELLDHGITATEARLALLKIADDPKSESPCSSATKQNLKGVIDAAAE